MIPVKRSREVRIPLPMDTARLLCDRARERWHTHSNVVTGDNRTVVQVWPAHHLRLGVIASPFGSMTILWGSPVPSQACIVKLEWDMAQFGSEEAIRQAINTLVGWPVANDSTPTQPLGMRAAS